MRRSAGSSGRGGRVLEFGGEASRENYGTVPVAGTDDFGHNRLIDRTFNGAPFRVR